MLPEFCNLEWVLNLECYSGIEKLDCYTGLDSLPVETVCLGVGIFSFYGDPCQFLWKDFSATVTLSYNSVLVQTWVIDHRIPCSKLRRKILSRKSFHASNFDDAGYPVSILKKLSFQVELRYSKNMPTWTGNSYKPNLAAMLSDPEGSFADLMISGSDRGTPILARQCVMGLCADYFRTCIKYAKNVPDGGSNVALKTFRVQELTTPELKLFVRRIYGEQFPTTLGVEKSNTMLLNLWAFATVTQMNDIQNECENFVVGSVTGTSFADCYRMARRLDRFNIQNALRMVLVKEMTYLGHKSLERFTSEGMVSLISTSPPTAMTLGWGDSWLKHDPARASSGSLLFEAFPFDELPVSEKRRDSET